jgi:hypothetical protein
MNAERKGNVRAATALAARAIVDAGEADHSRFDVVVAARIKQWHPRRAARTPVFGNAVVAATRGIAISWAGSGATTPSVMQLELIARLRPTIWGQA